jgi:hypothetical protein
MNLDTTTVYDEVRRDVSDRIDLTGSIGKADIGALLLWKRLRAEDGRPRLVESRNVTYRHPRIGRSTDSGSRAA